MGEGPFERILVWLPNWVGDVVMATPLLRALRGGFGSARIDYVGRPAALEVMAGTEWADGMIPDRTSWLGDWASLARRLRAERYNLAVLLPNSLRTALIAAWGRAERILGYDRDWRGRWLTDKVETPRDDRRRPKVVPQIDYYIGIGEFLGVPCDDRGMTLRLRPEDRAAADAELRAAGVEAGRPLVMVNPGASYGSSKMWMPERYAGVADALIESRGAQVIVHAAPSERGVAGRVVGAMARKPAMHFADRDSTIGLLKALLARSSLLITNDTGARHVAAAMDTPVVTLFGSTDPERTRLDYARERIVRVDVPCSPCQRKRCPLPRGPGHHECMTTITSEMVLQAASELLDLAAAPSHRSST